MRQSKPKIYYKLTTGSGWTRIGYTNATCWGKNVTHEATGDLSQGLCSDAFIHAYEHPLIAVFRNYSDAKIENPILWEGVGEGENRIEYLKCGFRKFTTLRRIPIPKMNKTQKRAFAILAVQQMCKHFPSQTSTWNSWANAWLKGKRSQKRNQGIYLSVMSQPNYLDYYVSDALSQAIQAMNPRNFHSCYRAVSSVLVYLRRTEFKPNFVSLIKKAMKVK